MRHGVSDAGWRSSASVAFLRLRAGGVGAWLLTRSLTRAVEEIVVGADGVDTLVGNGDGWSAM